ncbi:MAG: hypothetical protein ACHQPI_00555 [Thermoanaerobaculia bacterium]
MFLRQVRIVVWCCLWAALPVVAGALPPGDQPGTPQVIRNPEGGGLIVRTFPKATEEMAVTETLKDVSQLLGDRPRLGKLFRDKRDQILMAFLEVRALATDGKPYLGLILVAPIPGGQQAAVILDESQRFPKTEPQMLRTLFGSPDARNARPAAPPVPQLVPTAFPDQSGQVGLAPGWRISYGSMGTGVIDGPRGEKVMINLSYSMIDARSPYAQYNPGSARLSWGTDLVQAWTTALPIRCRALGLPMLSISVTRTQRMPADSGWASVYVEGLADRHDGLGTRDLRAQLWGANLGNGVWTLYETSIQLPQAISAQVMPTAVATVSSFRMNNQVITDAYQVRLQGQRAAFEAQQASHRSQQAAIEAQHAGYWARQDANARQAQGFHNYLLDQTVVTDNEGRRGTLSNNAATALIKGDPSRFQEVPTSQYLKGWDY